MNKLKNAIKYDFNFIKSHTLQPRWWKVAKVFLILAFIAGYYLLFGLTKTVMFVVVFMILSTIVHLVYRAKTKQFTQSWLDFIVIEEEGQKTYERIGMYYYSAIIVNALLAFFISQLLG